MGFRQRTEAGDARKTFNICLEFERVKTRYKHISTRTAPGRLPVFRVESCHIETNLGICLKPTIGLERVNSEKVRCQGFGENHKGAERERAMSEGLREYGALTLTHTHNTQ